MQWIRAVQAYQNRWPQWQSHTPPPQFEQPPSPSLSLSQAGSGSAVGGGVLSGSSCSTSRRDASCAAISRRASPGWRRWRARRPPQAPPPASACSAGRAGGPAPGGAGRPATRRQAGPRAAVPRRRALPRSTCRLLAEADLCLCTRCKEVQRQAHVDLHPAAGRHRAEAGWPCGQGAARRSPRGPAACAPGMLHGVRSAPSLTRLHGQR